MRLDKLQVKNYRSIKDTGEVRIEALQAFVGENNSGKSNIIRALQCFLSSGAGGTSPSDFNDPGQTIIIECEFSDLTDAEKQRLRSYLIGDKVVLRKEMVTVYDDVRDRTTVKAEYHGYQAEPTETHLSIPKIEASFGARPKWSEIAGQHGLTAFLDDPEKVSKAQYTAAIARYLAENDVKYDEPKLGETQALGIAQNLLAALPEFYLLPAITDYSDEIDKRSTTTVFRRLMADLSDRIMQSDPRYTELETALKTVHDLLNSFDKDGGRLEALGKVEESLRDAVQKMMPSVSAVNLTVEVDTSKDVFAKGVSIRIDDGALTDVLDKGHGMQRSFVFALLQMLMAAGRAKGTGRPIILAIEEPELYIHPHCQRLIFQVLREFAGIIPDPDGKATGSDQVIYSTHSPAFVEVANYERIAMVKKLGPESGTTIHQAIRGVIGNPDDRKTFKMLTSFGLKHNELFFSRYAILVEGIEDEIAVIATARKLGRIVELPDEIGVSIVVTTGKGDIHKFQQVLNAFGHPYAVFLELDNKPEDDKQTKPILDFIGTNSIAKVVGRLEDVLHRGHFDDQRQAALYFSDPANINADLEAVVAALLPAI